MMKAGWDKQLFIYSTWEADPAEVPCEFQALVSHFLRKLKPKFQIRPVKETNSTALQNRLLQQSLKISDYFIGFPLDQNLGPAVLKCSKYIIPWALKDHLADLSTYQQLSSASLRS